MEDPKKVEITRIVGKVKDILYDASISIGNAEAITEYQKTLPSTLGMHAAFRHLYRVHRFHAVTQLAKLISTGNHDK